MKTFDIEIPDQIYERGIRYAKEADISFSEVCSLSLVQLVKCSDDELVEMAIEIQELFNDERR